MLGLFVIALGIFLLPFAFPTPPPIITRFQSTRLFSPNDDGRREVAKASIRVREAGRLTLEVTADGTVIDTLIDDQPVRRGWTRATWDGRTADGSPVADGVYGLRLYHRAGEKNFRASRRIIVDSQPPRFESVTAVSVGGATDPEPPAQCRITVQTEGATRVRIARTPRPTGGAPLDPPIVNRPIRDDVPSVLRWTGPRDGSTPGLVGVSIRADDTARNRASTRRTCWIGGIRGTATPASPRPLELVRVRLSGRDGTPLDSRTPVTLQLYRRVGTPGPSTRVLGARVARPLRTTAGEAFIRVPPRIPPRTLWLVAETADGRALIPLGSP